jgi:hypothetical protein
MADRGQQIRNILNEFGDGFHKDYNIGREDTQRVFYRKRELKGLQAEAPRGESMAGTHMGVTRLREALGKVSPEHAQALKEADMNLDKSKSLPHQVGQFGGTLAADITQDATRSAWWLINALQATGDLVNEAALSRVTPELYMKSPVKRDVNVMTDGGKTVQQRDIYKGVSSDVDWAAEQGLFHDVDGKSEPRRGYSWGKNKVGEEVLQKRNYSPGMIAALSIPAGLAINNGLGLLTPMGGSEGFKAVNPTPGDPTKSNNVLMEVASKYILGKTGALLPYDEFKKVRPDVSIGEYKAYQADKFDNREDWNPLDGDVSLLSGALKANTEGILGPEVSMLGRSLPVTTGGIPLVTAIAGAAAGSRIGHDRYKRGAMGGLVGGLSGVAAGSISGSIIENERRRRNGVANGELPLS